MSNVPATQNLPYALTRLIHKRAPYQTGCNKINVGIILAGINQGFAPFK